jgi:hypothetical protein
MKWVPGALSLESRATGLSKWPFKYNAKVENMELYAFSIRFNAAKSN